MTVRLMAHVCIVGKCRKLFVGASLRGGVSGMGLPQGIIQPSLLSLGVGLSVGHLVSATAVEVARTLPGKKCRLEC